MAISSQNQLQLVNDSAVLAVYHVVDVTSSGYTPGAAAAVEIELALLAPCNVAQIAMSTVASNTSSLLDAVRAINGHVVNNTTGTATAKVKLDTWVNTTMGTIWGDGVPNGWQELSEDAGYDTTDWNVSPSQAVHSH